LHQRFGPVRVLGLKKGKVRVRTEDGKHFLVRPDTLSPLKDDADASPMTGEDDAWRERARELANWAWGRCVVRTDVWGGYTREVTPQGAKTQPLTRPAVRDRGRVELSRATLRAHFEASDTHAVIGLHTTSPDNTSRWGAVEVDRHGEGGDTKANRTGILALYRRLVKRGFHPLLTDSNGKGGYHLRILFREPVPTPDLFQFLRWLVADHADLGLTAPPETFPKQPEVAQPGQNGQYGNWLRLPGRHHSREHWSRVWNGSTWLRGHKAIDYVVALGGDPRGLLPAPVAATPVAPSETQRAQRSTAETSVAPSETQRAQRTQRSPPPTSVSSEFSVSSVFHMGLNWRKADGHRIWRALRKAVRVTQPRTPGRRHRQLFELCRRLRGIDGLAGVKPAALRFVVAEWHRRAEPVITTKPFLDTWTEFLESWDKVKIASGQGQVDEAFRRAREQKPPRLARQLFPDEQPVQLLAGLCRELQRAAGDQPFYLDCRTAGRLLKVSHATAWRWLKVLFVAEGILAAGASGTFEKHKANEYRYLLD
jgi:hypothetical protein